MLPELSEYLLSYLLLYKRANIHVSCEPNEGGRSEGK